MQTSICFTLRQYGVLIAILHMLGMLVSMLIIGKTSEGNPMSTNMRRTNVQTGKQRISYKHMLMVANMSTDVNTLMGGRSKSIIHLITRCMHVVSKMCA